MASEYKVLISWDDLGLKEDSKSGVVNPLEKEQQVQEKNKSPETKASNNKSNDMIRQLQTAAAIYGFGRQGSQMAVNYISANYQIRGESLKAERLQTNFSNVTNNIGLGLGVGMSVMTGNPIAIAMTAYGLAQRAFNLALETRKYQAEISAERYRSQYYQTRLVRDISEVR